MPKYKITWDAGFGKSEDVVEAEDLNDAMDMAYQAWHDEAASNADWDAVLIDEDKEDEDQ